MLRASATRGFSDQRLMVLPSPSMRSIFPRSILISPTAFMMDFSMAGVVGIVTARGMGRVEAFRWSTNAPGVTSREAFLHLRNLISVGGQAFHLEISALNFAESISSRSLAAERIAEEAAQMAWGFPAGI